MFTFDFGSLRFEVQLYSAKVFVYSEDDHAYFYERTLHSDIKLDMEHKVLQAYAEALDVEMREEEEGDIYGYV